MRYLFIILAILYYSASMAQNSTDYIPDPHTPKEIEIKIKMSDFEKLNKEEEEDKSDDTNS